MFLISVTLQSLSLGHSIMSSFCWQKTQPNKHQRKTKTPKKPTKAQICKSWRKIDKNIVIISFLAILTGYTKVQNHPQLPTAIHNHQKVTQKNSYVAVL